ncbi:hypothetical protein DFH09DRAFT_1294772 [Mycena vulgaris]|nr:hypothetical protein DFH09DRAFT_1294772 [Mycena vulgaris]
MAGLFGSPPLASGLPGDPYLSLAPKYRAHVDLADLVPLQHCWDDDTSPPSVVLSDEIIAPKSARLISYTTLRPLHPTSSGPRPRQRPSRLCSEVNVQDSRAKLPSRSRVYGPPTARKKIEDSSNGDLLISEVESRDRGGLLLLLDSHIQDWNTCDADLKAGPSMAEDQGALEFKLWNHMPDKGVIIRPTTEGILRAMSFLTWASLHDPNRCGDQVGRYLCAAPLRLQSKLLLHRPSIFWRTMYPTPSERETILGVAGDRHCAGTKLKFHLSTLQAINNPTRAGEMRSDVAGPPVQGYRPADPQSRPDSSTNKGRWIHFLAKHKNGLVHSVAISQALADSDLRREKFSGRDGFRQMNTWTPGPRRI